MKIVAHVQVRMNSTRLPGKVMKEIVGKPVLGHIVDRIIKSRFIDEIVITTSINPEDDQIEDYCSKNSIACFRGSEEDVLDRVLKALDAHNANVGVCIYGDCPLIDPEIISDIIGIFLKHKGEYDFVSNDLKTTYPPGTEVQVYSVNALRDSSNRTDNIAIREHVTLFIRQHPEIYRICNIEAPPELNLPDLEIELDTEEDLVVIKAIYENLYQYNVDFRTIDVIKFMNENPELLAVNRSVTRRWKEFRQD